MQPDRGSDLVVAGMNPAKSIGASSAFARIHRGTSFIVFIDGFIILLLLWDFSSVFSSKVSNIILIIFGLINFSIWNSYRSRKSWAFWPGSSLILMAGIIFSLISIFNLYFLILGNVSAMLYLLLTGWAALGSIRRFMFHFNPSYSSA